uniref:PUM-HD domain-containing protein n=1 Tax=Oryza brachyantha TaxID=4533 RepID=J3M5N1_ORYBR
MADLMVGAAGDKDVPSEHTSTPDEKFPIEVDDMHFPCDIQSKAEVHIACGTLKDPSYRAIYGCCNYEQIIGLGNSQYTLARPSTSQRVCTDIFSGAIGSDHLNLHKHTTADGNTEARSELKRNAIGGLLGEGILLAKSGKHIEEHMVLALSAQPYNPVCPVSQGVSSYNSSSQHIVSSSGVAKYIQNSGQEMQIACEIAKEPAHIALYGSKNPYESTRLSDPHDKFIVPSSFQGVNIGTISNTSSGMNFPTNSAKESAEYNQTEIQNQMDGYQRFEFGLGLNRDDVGCLTITGVPQKGQLGPNMVKDLSAEPYQPVFPVSHGTSASLSSKHPNVTSKLLENPEYHSRIPCTQPSLQPTIKVVSTSMTPHVEEPCYQENFCLADSSLRAQGIDDVGVGNPSMSLLCRIAVSSKYAENKSPTMIDKVHADISKIESTLDHQTSANNMKIQYAPQAARQPSQQSLHADVAKTYSPFGHHFAANIKQRQFAPQVATKPSYMSLHGGNNRNLKTGSGSDSQTELIRPSSSHSTNTDVISSALPKFNLQDQNHQCVHEMDLDEATNSNMLTAKQQLERKVQRNLQRHCKKIDASEARTQHGNVETSIRRDPAKEFLEIVRHHEACFVSFYHPTHIPAHVMKMFDQCFGVDMKKEMPFPKSYPTRGYGTVGLAHQSSTFGLERSDLDSTLPHESKSLDNEELNALLFQREFSSLSKGNYRLIHIEGHVFQCSIDQCGSRFIQQKLPTATPEEKFMVFKEIMPHVVDLVIDVYGNYVLKKVLLE